MFYGKKKEETDERTVRVLLSQMRLLWILSASAERSLPQVQGGYDISCEARDELLSTRIIATSSPYVRRLLAPHKVNNNREIIARMGDRITELEIENEKLNKTIEWMHQTIWELMRKTKGLDPGNEDTSKTGIDP